MALSSQELVRWVDENVEACPPANSKIVWYFCRSFENIYDNRTIYGDILENLALLAACPEGGEDLRALVCVERAADILSLKCPPAWKESSDFFRQLNTLCASAGMSLLRPAGLKDGLGALGKSLEALKEAYSVTDLEMKMRSSSMGATSSQQASAERVLLLLDLVQDAIHYAVEEDYAHLGALLAALSFAIPGTGVFMGPVKFAEKLVATKRSV